MRFLLPAAPAVALMTTAAGAEEVRILGLGSSHCGPWTAAQVALAIDTKFV